MRTRLAAGATSAVNLIEPRLTCEVGASKTRQVLSADAEGPNDQRHALDEQENAEHERDGEGGHHRRAQQQNADEEIEDAENERSNAATGEAGDDPENANEQRPDPRDGAIDEHTHKLQHADEQPVEAKENGDGHHGRGWLGEEQEANQDCRDSLKQKDPPV